MKKSPYKNFRINLKIQILRGVVHRRKIIMDLHKVLNVYSYILLCETPAFRISLYNIALDDGFYDEYILDLNEIMIL